MIQEGKNLLGRSMHGHGEAIRKPLEIMRMILPSLLSLVVHVRLGACKKGESPLFLEVAGKGERSPLPR
jgi:hypothetical protein